MSSQHRALKERTTCSVEEAARLLKIGRSTAYAAVRDGSLPSLRLSHRILIPTAKLAAMLGLEEQVRSTIEPRADAAPTSERGD